YSGKWGQDPVKVVHLRLNNLPRFGGREGRYFRLVEPYQYHTLIPESFTYCFSFALFPEEPQPSGSMNASRIDNIELMLELQDALSTEQVQIVVFGRNWNIFRYREGLGGQALKAFLLCLLCLLAMLAGFAGCAQESETTRKATCRACVGIVV